jgi:2-keto-3-deoxy-L-rhamnonate aldolase RhmA
VAAISRYSDDYARVANRTVACLVMIETAEALGNLDQILSVPGIDAVYVGPVDLSLTLGLPPEADHDESASPGRSTPSWRRAPGTASCPASTPTRIWPRSGRPGASG